MTQAAVNNAIVLYRLSVDRESVEKASKLYFETPKLQEVLCAPTVPLNRKFAVIDKVFALDNTPKVLVDYIKMMCRLGECESMSEIFDAYYKYWDKQNKVLRAELISSSSEDDYREEAESFLKQRQPGYKIELTETVDESLLGGYVIRANHKEYDRSFEGRFRQLERKLT